MAAKVLLTLSGLALALLLPSWTYLGGWTSLIAIAISSLAAGWLTASLVPRPWSAGAGAAVGIPMLVFGGASPYRGMYALATPMSVGYLLVAVACALGAYALRRRWSFAFVVLGVQALLVLPGLLSLDLVESPRRTVYRYARAVATQDWERAYALLTPELRAVESRGEYLPNNLEYYLPNPRGSVFLGVDSGADRTTVRTGYPRSWRVSGGFRGSMRPLVLKRQADGRWLIHGFRRREAEDILRERMKYEAEDD